MKITELSTNQLNEFKVPEIDKMIDVKAFPLKHTVPCLGYSFVFSRKPVFNPQKAEELKIPKQMWSILHSGKSIEIDGQEITTEMVTDGIRKPVKVTYATDSRPIYEIADAAFRSDLFICEGMYGDDENDQSMKEKGHMLFSDAIRIAKDAEVERLWLTHYSPAMATPMQYEKEIKKKFPGAVISVDGQKINL